MKKKSPRKGSRLSPKYLLLILGVLLLIGTMKESGHLASNFITSSTNFFVGLKETDTTNPRTGAVQQQVEKTLSKTTGFCEGKDGVLMIQGGDGEAAVGTMFFMYVVNHLIYADLYNLVPWVHLNPDYPCYDESVHGNYTTAFTMLSGVRETRVYGEGDMQCNYWRAPQPYPGKPEYDKDLKPMEFSIIGNGLWQSYFQPMSGYPPDDPSCKDKPLLQLFKRSRFPGMHVCAPWGVRPWAVPHTPVALQPRTTVREWQAPMRERGSEKVAKYFRPLKWMEELIAKANPGSKKCLSMHIRMTDKGNGRKKKPLTLFQPYAEEYTRASGGGSLFIATDDGTIFDVIRSEWKISDLHSQENIIRSSGTNAIFRTFQNETHRTNTEGIVDMYALSRCDFFVHGFSAMAEAAVFVNPALHNRSVNIDAPPEQLPSAADFGKMVEDYYKTK
jgi:hypothetical protein